VTLPGSKTEWNTSDQSRQVFFLAFECRIKKIIFCQQFDKLEFS